MSAFSQPIRDFLSAPEESRRLGPYKCTALLDKAGTAPVFRAVEEHAGQGLREVAIKVFDIAKPKAGDKPGESKDAWQARVVDEARSLCRVQHPNVVRFHTLATDPKRGLMGLVMEFVEGVSFDKELASVPAGDARRVTLAVDVGIAIASALSAAHEAGVVHCNVKPSNVMSTGGTYKLLNFGLAASLGEADEEAESSARGSIVDLAVEAIGTKASRLEKGAGATVPILGTVGYVDPVCLKTTAQPMAASDVYSLGVTLYECLAGDVPAVATPKHGGKSGVDAKVLVGDTPPAPIADIASGIPADLAKLVDSMVAPTREARPRSADAVRRALERIGSALAGRARELPPEDRGPFPGLDKYDASDRDVFFGRSAEVAAVLEVARTRGLVGVVGLSGAGKSSLTRAGVVPAIEDGALGGWPSKYRSVVVTPGRDLMAALSAELEKVIGAPLAKHPEAIVEQLSAEVDAKGEGIVVLVDQLEEVVLKLDPDKAEERTRALDLLARLADAPAGLRAVVVVRRDFFDALLAVDPVFSRALARGTQNLGPLGAAAWDEVVDQSLEAYGYRFEDDALRKEVLADVMEREAAMTLVQFGLSRMWAGRDEKKKVITRAAFGEKGGTKGALERYAAETISELKIPREKLRDVVLAMTTPEGTRAHVELDAIKKRFGDEGKEAVLALAKARLVASEKAGFTFVHDSILREWGLVRGWIQEARDDRLLVAHVDRDAARWTESQDAAELWRKSRLAAALDLWKRGAIPLGDDARRFLRASKEAENRAQLARWGVGLAIVLMLVGGALFYAKLKSDAAAQARKDADALAAALEEVKTLKRQAEESAMEAATSAKLLQELQQKMAEERKTYGKNVQAALKKVETATTLDGAQKATQELKGQAGPDHNQVVPIATDLLGGPSSPKLDTSGPSPSTAGTFDQGAIERVVATRKAGVKRTCLDRSSGTAASSKVTATVTIAPNGSVQNVATAGDDPVMAKCIEQQLRTWSFPAPGETKQVQIPFVFVRQ